MINRDTLFDEDYFISKISKISKSAVTKSDTAEAGQIPVSDGEGGVTWGAATTGVVSAIDPDNDGNVTLQFIEGE